MNNFPCEETKYGFKWGPADVTRCISDPKFGVVMEVVTKRQRLQVRVTPSGLIRVKINKVADHICRV